MMLDERNKSVNNIILRLVSYEYKSIEPNIIR